VYAKKYESREQAPITPPQTKKTRSLSDTLKVYGGALLLTAAAFFITYQFVQPAPPDTLTIATGRTDGAYYAYAQQFKKELAKEKIELTILETSGSIANIDLLDSNQALGSLYFEPVWVFVRKGNGVEQLNQLNGAKIAVGQKGSGTRSVANAIMADNLLDDTNVEIFELSGLDAVDAFRQNQLDVIFSVGSHNAASIQAALNDLLLQISARLFSQSTLFSTAGQFPSDAFVDFPISSEARRFYKSGAPFLQRYLPFWAATLLDRLKVMLVPLLALLIPLFKILPPTYRWTVRKKIYKWYDEIQLIDQSANELGTESNLERCLANLDKIEDEVRTVEVPLGYAYELYVLRQHIDLLAKQISAHEQVLEQQRLTKSA